MKAQQKTKEDTAAEEEKDSGSKSARAIKTKLINRSHVKAFALAAAAGRAHQFTRVGGEFFLKAEAHLREFIRSYVRSLPSKGKTIT